MVLTCNKQIDSRVHGKAIYSAQMSVILSDNLVVFQIPTLHLLIITTTKQIRTVSQTQIQRLQPTPLLQGYGWRSLIFSPITDPMCPVRVILNTPVAKSHTYHESLASPGLLQPLQYLDCAVTGTCGEPFIARIYWNGADPACVSTYNLQQNQYGSESCQNIVTYMKYTLTLINFHGACHSGFW